MDVPGSYDTVADEYTRRIADELRHKPFDRELLDRFAAQIAGRGIVAEAGFELVERFERAPYSDVEAPTNRVYLLSVLPQAPSASG